MKKKPIDIELAKGELNRINEWLSVPHLLIGGLAIQRFIPTRNSKDIDLICEFETSRRLVADLYPSDQWNTTESKDDSFRPSFVITRRDDAQVQIFIGPKIVERGLYPFVDWDKLRDRGMPYSLRGRNLEKIIIPSCTDLAYTKLISFLSRDKALASKKSQDLDDLTDLSNHSEFNLIEFVTQVFADDTRKLIQGNFVLTDEQKKIFERSALSKVSNLFGETHAAFTKTSGSPTRKPKSIKKVMPLIEDEVVSIAAKNALKSPPSTTSRSILIVVDVQCDFFEGGALPTTESASLIAPLNDAIQHAERLGWAIVFTRDWHPTTHMSFEDWGMHCVADTPGARFHSDLYMPQDSIVVDIGTQNAADGYSPFDDSRLVALLTCPTVQTVFVAGMALEFCVLATCRDAAWFRKSVIALEPLIRSAQPDPKKREIVWNLLTSIGTVRAQNIPFGSF